MRTRCLKLFVFFVATMAALNSCAANGRASAADSLLMEENTELLPVPEVPDSIFDPIERADFVILHYWDALDFGDKEKTADKSFMEAAFEKYAELCLYGSDSGIDYAVNVLLRQLEPYPALYRQMAELARRNFAKKDSPYRNDETYRAWLRALTSSNILDATEQTRFRYELEALMKNMEGHPAQDIELTLRDGSKSSLYDLRKTPYTLLVLYDPECETCHEVIERVRNDSRLTPLVSRGTVRMLLVDVGEDYDLFRRDAAELPANWTVAYDRSRIMDNDIYIFDATPALYLLDADKKVIIREATVDQLIDYARTH